MDVLHAGSPRRVYFLPGFLVCKGHPETGEDRKQIGDDAFARVLEKFLFILLLAAFIIYKIRLQSLPSVQIFLLFIRTFLQLLPQSSDLFLGGHLIRRHCVIIETLKLYIVGPFLGLYNIDTGAE